MRSHFICAIVLGLSLLVLTIVFFPLPVLSQPPAPFLNCRLGVDVNWAPFGDPNLADLNLGWYSNFTLDSSPIPEGMEFVRTIRLNQKHGNPYDSKLCPYGSYSCYAYPPTYTLRIPGSLAALEQEVRDNPGSLWAVGNEPDGRQWWNGETWQDNNNWVGQDEITPEVYAVAFCEISRLIHATDPTARVAIGGVIQGTPLRLEYLDRIWNAYPGVCNGRRLSDDVDVWNMHNYVLREASVKCYPKAQAWGAEIPPGLYPKYCKGQLTQPEDNGKVALATEQIVRFRTWMASKGLRDKPLIITEGGLNLGSYWVLSSTVQSFLTSYLDFVLNYKDANIGNPLDENRLIQRFQWWSLNHNATIDPDQESGHTCYPECTLHVDSLIGSVTRQVYRQRWVEYVTDPAHLEASTPIVRLFVGRGEAIRGPGDPTTYTLKAHIFNGGNTASSGGDTVQFYEATENGPGAPIGAPQVLPKIAGCLHRTAVEQSWPNQPADSEPAWCVSINDAPATCFTLKDVYLPYVVHNQ